MSYRQYDILHSYDYSMTAGFQKIMADGDLLQLAPGILPGLAWQGSSGIDFEGLR